MVEFGFGGSKAALNLVQSNGHCLHRSVSLRWCRFSGYNTYTCIRTHTYGV